ncbi:hypothetical protein P2868_16210 [Lactiplantibacillus plantarum]|uniref:hypothetical protein n=1 Tax=Lactiplantibacillus plantarum TaxID=1590 RepID=UPI0023DF20AE|nr:hypothetical protein [Lactiplantibacillus plantarum]MDF3266284.1 hypothetical protein [Lactiplantibacillus plantarum]
MATVDALDMFLTDYANISRYLNTRLNSLLATQHLTFDAFLIMHEIGQNPRPLLLMEIAHQHHVSRSAISRPESSSNIGTLSNRLTPLIAAKKDFP